jgi:MFS family permease
VRLFDRAVIERWYFAGLFASMATQGLLPMLIPQHVFQTTHSAFSVGLVMAALSGGGILGIPIGGWLQKSGSLKPAAVVSGLILVATTTAIALTTNMLAWLILSAVNGAAQAAIMVIGGLLVTQRWPQSQWSKRQSASIMVYALGTSFGLFLAAAFPGARAGAGLLVTAGIFAVALLWSIFAWPQQSTIITKQATSATPKPEDSEKLPVAPSIEKLSDDADTSKQSGRSNKSAATRFAMFVVAFGFVNLASSTLFFQYPILAKEVYGIDPTWSALIMGFGALVSVPLFGLTGKLSQRYGAIKVVGAASLARTTIFGLLALIVFLSGAWQIVLAGFMFFLYRNTWPFIFAGGQVGATDLVPGNRQGAALGIFTASFSITNAAAGLISGAVAGSIGYSWLPLVSFGMNLVATVLFGSLLLSSPAARQAMILWGRQFSKRFFANRQST